jgi:hypothetical protein
MSEELVGRLQAWREIIILPRWVIDEVKDLVRAKTKAESALAQAQADVEALREQLTLVLSEDLAGRSFSNLLREASGWMNAAGGGPMADCLAGKWGVVLEAEQWIAALPAPERNNR